MARLDADEIAWVLECAAAGDSPEEIAGTAGLTVADVQCALGQRRPLTAYEREAASLYAAGTALRDIGLILCPSSARPHQLAAATIHKVRQKGHELPRRQAHLSQGRVHGLSVAVH